MRSKVVKCVVVVSFFLTILVLVRLYQELHTAYESSDTLSQNDYSWLFRLLLNLASYATILLPLFATYKYLERTQYFDKIHTPGCVYRALFTCFGSPGERLPEQAGGTSGVDPRDPSPRREGLHLALCFLGLMGTYLVWGLLQEKIMTQEYVLLDGTSVRFSSSSFLVLINRVSALVLATAGLLYSRQRVLMPPLYRFSYCSVTNIVSAWCQYEALKYLTFPTQVLSKSCKVVAVMMMGKVVSGNKYETYEYVTAGLITLGMFMFLGGTNQHDAETSAVSFGGVCLLVLYMLSDSFTANWQAQLFSTVRCSPLQMMCAVNLFSCLLTAVSLHGSSLHQAGLLFQSPSLAFDCCVLATCSAVGQLLIYRTVASFGANVFTIIMTLRQAVSILLSCVVYGHRVSAAGAAGVTIVFLAALVRVYCRPTRRVA